MAWVLDKNGGVLALANALLDTRKHVKTSNNPHFGIRTSIKPAIFLQHRVYASSKIILKSNKFANKLAGVKNSTNATAAIAFKEDFFDKMEEIDREKKTNKKEKAIDTQKLRRKL